MILYKIVYVLTSSKTECDKLLLSSSTELCLLFEQLHPFWYKKYDEQSTYNVLFL